MSQNSLSRRIGKLEASYAAEKRPMSCEEAEKMNAVLAEIFFNALANVKANPPTELIGHDWIDEIRQIGCVPDQKN